MVSQEISTSQISCTRRWEMDCKEQEEVSFEIFSKKKEEWLEEKATDGFRNDASDPNSHKKRTFKRKGRENSKPRGRPFFGEYDKGKPRRDINPSRRRQNNGRRPRGGGRSQSRGRKNNNDRRGRSGNRQGFPPNREQVVVNLPTGQE